MDKYHLPRSLQDHLAPNIQDWGKRDTVSCKKNRQYNNKGEISVKNIMNSELMFTDAYA